MARETVAALNERIEELRETIRELESEAERAETREQVYKDRIAVLQTSLIMAASAAANACALAGLPTQPVNRRLESGVASDG